MNVTPSTTMVTNPDPFNIMGRVGALIIVVMILLGSAGNFMVLVVVLKFPRLKKSYNTFIASLSATDLLFNILIMPFYADSYLNREWRFGKAFCHFHAFFGTVLIMCSSFHVSLIAMNRYFLVVRSSWYPKISRNWVLVLQIVLVWILAITSVAPGALGWRALVQYTDQVGRCTYVRSESKESLGIVFIIGFIVPCIIVFVAYTLIWLKSRRSKKRLRSYSCSDHHHHHHHHQWHFPLHDISLLEWLTSKLDHHHHHHHPLHDISSMRKGWQNYFYHFRHSLPTALEETNFDDRSVVPISRIECQQNMAEILPIISENMANDSPVIFTCGDEGAPAETLTSKPEEVGKRPPVADVKADLAMRVIKSYVRKKSESDLIKPMKLCTSCPELFELKKAHIIIPMLVKGADHNNVMNCLGRKIENLIKNVSTPSNEPSVAENESQDFSNLIRNPDCFGCLKTKKVQEAKVEAGQCPCKAGFSVVSHNESSLYNETENKSQKRQKESKKVAPEVNKSAEATNFEIDLKLNSLKRQTPSKEDLLSKSKHYNRRRHPSGNKVSDLNSGVASPQLILDHDFPATKDKQTHFNRCDRRRSSHKKRQSTKIILTIFFAFVFTYLPFTVINLADDKGKLSRNWYMITALGFWAGSCLNPYIYGAMNDQFRSAYCAILNSMIYFVCGRNRNFFKN